MINDMGASTWKLWPPSIILLGPLVWNQLPRDSFKRTDKLEEEMKPLIAKIHLIAGATLLWEK